MTKLPGTTLSAGKSAKDKVLLASRLLSTRFQARLGEASEEIRRGARLTATEATVAGRFERVLYAALREIGIEFHPEKEEQVDSFRHVGRSGRLDSRIGAVVIEYKRPSRLRTARQVTAARTQLADYLKARTSNPKSAAYGFLTDGRGWLEMRVVDGTVESYTPISGVNDGALTRLTRALISLDSTALTAVNLIRDFCGDSFDGVLFQVARALFKELASTHAAKTAMLYAEWKALFAIGHNDLSQQKRIQERRAVLSAAIGHELTDIESEYRALFALHSAYAIVIKMIAFRAVCDSWSGQASQFGSLLAADVSQLQIFCRGLEDGEVFRRIGILNLLEGDFFSWYSDKKQWTRDVSEAVRRVLEVLSRYEQATELFRSVGAVDVFRELYEATIPQVVRASFGEFYTPQWLASHVLESAVDGVKSFSVLDPCCGSGTFLVSAIERVRGEAPESISGADLLPQILKRVAGLDLNPLAVLMARVNYFIHIVDLLPKAVSRLIIPVFLGDASYVPTIRDISGVACVEYTLATIKHPIVVVLPLSVVRDTPSFMELMLEYERRVLDQDARQASQILVDAIPEGERIAEITKGIEELSNRLVELEKRGWNGIWARILANFLTTAAFDRFDAIIGNPPWIDWKNLPTSYRNKIKSLCIDRGLFSGDGRTGGINLNVCALISHVAAANWLKPGGRLAFLMPRELALQQSYEGWRTLRGSRAFIEFHDWSEAGHPFDPVKEDFMTFIIGPNSDSGRTVPLKMFRKKEGVRTKARLWPHLSFALQQLSEEDAVAGQIIPNKTIFTIAKNRTELDKFRLIAGECAYLGREGVEFYPQELIIFRPLRSGPRPGTWWFQNIQVQKSKYRVPQRDVLLETKYMFPLVKGAELERFKHEYGGTVVPFPYDAADTQRPITMAELRRHAPLLAQFYKDNEGPIKAQTGFSDKIRGPNPGEFYGLARVGPYSFQMVYAAFRDNTKWAAAVIRPAQTDWAGRRRFLFQNHAVSICERAVDRSFITEDEAFFITGILNCPIVEQFIYASSDQRSFKIRPPVYVPRFDAKIKLHNKIVEFSRQAHSATQDASRIATYRERLEAIYLELCRARGGRPTS